MFARKNWHRFAALSVFVGALALAGCGKKDDAPKAEGDPNPIPAEPTPPPAESLAKIKPDFTYTATALLQELQKEGNFLEKKGAGKVVEVTGEVIHYVVREGKYDELHLKTGEGVLDLFGCHVADKELWRKALPLQTATLRKRISDYGWELVEVKGPPPTTFTAEQFKKESAADPERFRKLYLDKPVIVTGVISKVEHKERSEIMVYLEGTGNEMWYSFPGSWAASVPLSEAQKTLLKTGQKVKVLGECRVTHFVFCLLLEPTP